MNDNMILDLIRASQFLRGRATKEILAWAEKPESKRIIENQRLLRLLEKEKKANRK